MADTGDHEHHPGSIVCQPVHSDPLAGGVMSERPSDERLAHFANTWPGRLSDYEVNGLARAAAHTVPGGRRLLLLAAEVQSSRKLLDDILALHGPDALGHWCTECGQMHPCTTVRLIEEHRRG